MTEEIRNATSCQDETDSALGAAQGLALIVDRLAPMAGRQSLDLRNALGRHLAEAVTSPLDVPAHRNSAMDGYALNGADLPSQGTRELKIAGRAMAGTPLEGAVARGECVRIMTGAKMPPGTDTVVIQERAEVHGDRVRVDAGNRAGQNVREAGEDIAAGSVVLEAGSRIGPAELGLLASLGIPEVRVRRRVRVAFFSSGDEIRSIGEPLSEGQIYDSNRYTLFGMLSRLGAEPVDMGVVPDREESISRALEEAAGTSDLVLTSGGVSVGEADYIAAAVRRLGTVHFAKLAIKPGRPLTFGHIGNTPFFGLPGNPVAVMITFLQFVRPGLKVMMGEAAPFTPGFRVRCDSRLRKSPGRTEFQRGVLQRNDEGELRVTSTGRQGSGVLSSMSAGNCFILLPEASGTVEPGDWVEVQPFELFDR